MDETLFQIFKVVISFTGAALGGFMAGLFPAAVALKRHTTKYAKISMMVCIPIGIAGGLLMAFVAALILIVVVLIRVPAPSQQEMDEDMRQRFKH